METIFTNADCIIPGTRVWDGTGRRGSVDRVRIELARRGFPQEIWVDISWTDLGYCEHRLSEVQIVKP